MAQSKEVERWVIQECGLLDKEEPREECGEGEIKKKKLRMLT